MSIHPIPEGGIKAPTRHSINWQDPEFVDEESLFTELERVYNICHGCRRCVNLCKAFPTLFDLVDESSTLEIDGVKKSDYWKVVDHCYLCDLCYMTKCPYVPPHEWNVDFPHLMLRAKATRFQQNGASRRDRLLTNTDAIGRLAGIPIVVNTINTANRSTTGRKLLEKVLGVHKDALLPKYHARTLRRRMRNHKVLKVSPATTETTRGKVALFTTCYGNFNQPEIVENLVAVLEHNQIPVTLVSKERCCAMPKLELGDLKAVARAREFNQPPLIELINNGWDIIAPVPSCVLMFKQELPLLFPEDQDLARLRKHWFDPFEYLFLRNREGLLNTSFQNPLGKVVYHAACHQRVQNFGPRTRDLLQLVPNTEVITIARCSGHDGTYAVKKETHRASMTIARPVIRQIDQAMADHYGSDCPIAAQQFQNGLADNRKPKHPISLLRLAYGI
jgi:Fe-S oxidoreductase